MYTHSEGHRGTGRSLRAWYLCAYHPRAIEALDGRLVRLEVTRAVFRVINTLSIQVELFQRRCCISTQPVAERHDNANRTPHKINFQVDPRAQPQIQRHLSLRLGGPTSSASAPAPASAWRVRAASGHNPRPTPTAPHPRVRQNTATSRSCFVVSSSSLCLLTA